MHKIDELLQRITDGDSLLSIINNGVDSSSYSPIFQRIENDAEFRAIRSRALFKLNALNTRFSLET